MSIFRVVWKRRTTRFSEAVVTTHKSAQLHRRDGRSAFDAHNCFSLTAMVGWRLLLYRRHISITHISSNITELSVSVSYINLRVGHFNIHATRLVK